MTLLLTLLLAGSWIAGCGEESAEDEEYGIVSEDSAIGVQTGGLATNRPQSIGTRMKIAGDSTEIRLRLVDDAVLPFSTYVPDGIIQGERVTHDGGTAIRFFANLNGTLNKDASLTIFFPSKDSSYERLQESVVGDSGMVFQMGWKAEKGGTAGAICPWARESFTFAGPSDGKNIRGMICFGVHRNRPFYVLVQYPGDYAGAFVPRVQRILEEYRWDDSGEGLYEGKKVQSSTTSASLDSIASLKAPRVPKLNLEDPLKPPTTPKKKRKKPKPKPAASAPAPPPPSGE